MVELEGQMLSLYTRESMCGYSETLIKIIDDSQATRSRTLLIEDKRILLNNFILFAKCYTAVILKELILP